MNLFYCPEIVKNTAILSSEESAHCVRVLRLKKDDIVRLIDGKGGMFDALISIADARHCTLKIINQVYHQKNRDFALHIAIAPTKNIERFEWFVEKAVEIGIDSITPLLCHRSERRILKTDRLHKLILSTMKQAMVPYLPDLNELTEFDTFVNSLAGSRANRFIAHCNESEKRKLKDVCTPGSNVAILIGPEGDFTVTEIELALDHEFIPVSLGINRLRTETAGIVACHTVNLINEFN